MFRFKNPETLGSLKVTHTSGPVEIFNTTTDQRLDQVQIEQNVVYQELWFDPEVGLRKAIGDI